MFFHKKQFVIFVLLDWCFQLWTSVVWDVNPGTSSTWANSAPSGHGSQSASEGTYFKVHSRRPWKEAQRGRSATRNKFTLRTSKKQKKINNIKNTRASRYMHNKYEKSWNIGKPSEIDRNSSHDEFQPFRELSCEADIDFQLNF